MENKNIISERIPEMNRYLGTGKGIRVGNAEVREVDSSGSG
jgi:hypothetical protein